MNAQQIEKRLVIVAVGDNVVVEDQHKKDDDHAQKAYERRAAQLFQSRFVIDVVVLAGNVVEQNPENGDENDAENQRRLTRCENVKVCDVADNQFFAEYKKQYPREKRGQIVGRHIFDNLQTRSFLFHFDFCCLA